MKTIKEPTLYKKKKKKKKNCKFYNKNAGSQSAEQPL